jgi:CheY-like chemotaxis protein
MKILVIEDKEMHRTAATETLAGHDLTIVASFDEAIEAMSTHVDYNELNRLCDEAVGKLPENPTDAEHTAWYEKSNEFEPQVTTKPNFEVVLTDMNMPMSRQTLARGVFKREEVPYGFILALRAATIGAKYIAMVTDTNHHQGAISAALDHLGASYYSGNEKPFEINGAKVLFLHAPFVKDVVKDAPCESCAENPGVCSWCNGTLTHKTYGGKCDCAKRVAGKCYNCQGTTKYDKKVSERKDWGRVLAHLTGETQTKAAAE